MKETRTYAIEDFSGAILLILALFGLGLFNFKSDEPLVEAGLRAQSAAIVAETVHGLRVSVDGREMTLSGLADSREEKTRVLTALKKLEGRGRIRTEVEVLEPAEPFIFSAVHARGAPMRFSGAVPTEALRQELRRDHGDGVETLTLASGMPDEDWPATVTTALRGLEQLERGELRVTGRELVLSGEALTPDVTERIALLMQERPDSYAFSTSVEVIDDGSPLRLTASRSDGGPVVVSGKLPAALAGDFPDGEIALSPLSPPFADWDAAVRHGVSALQQLQNGHLAVIGASLTLTGEAWSQSAYDGVRRSMEHLPGQLSVSLQISLADSGSPFALSLDYDRSGLRAEGKVPTSLGPRVLAALVDAPVTAPDLEIARVSPGEDWWLAASLGTEALRWFEKGQMRFDGAALALSGVVQDPPVLERLQRHLKALPENVALTLDVDLIDDGTPLRLLLEFNGDTGVASGKLPDHLAPELLAEPLGAPVLAGDVVHTPRPGAENWDEAVLTGASILSRFERGSLSVEGTSMVFRGVLRDPARESEVLEALANLPDGYEASAEITFQDDGRPFAFRLSYDGQRGTLSGKVPLDLGPASQAAIAGFPIEAGELDFAAIPADADWWSLARAGLKALADLGEGELTLDAFHLRLSGRAADDAVARAAEARLAPFQDDFKIELDISKP